jgi:cytochrome c oxidase subunit 3
MSIHGYKSGTVVMTCSLGLSIAGGILWWRDIVRESTFKGDHTSIVQYGLKLGFLLFIISEVMFFFSFFWGFFHSSLAPSEILGSVWPPAGVKVFDPWKVPLLNTYILLLSGAMVTACHHYMLEREKEESENYLLGTLVLAVLFTIVQGLEYITGPFSINDGIYGSTFFLLTGFHGLHVIVGTLFLGVCFGRLYKEHYTTTHHLGFEAGAWYWHFVDVVWLFLFVAVYWWGYR